MNNHLKYFRRRLAMKYFTKRGRRGALLLMIMVFVAVVGLGAMYVIPPIEKQGRSALEDNYSTRLENFYRSMHDYFMIEDMNSSITVALSGTAISKYGPPPYSLSTICGIMTDDSGSVNQDDKYAITRALMQEMLNYGYITKRQRDERIFPITSSYMTWEIELIPIY